MDKYSETILNILSADFLRQGPLQKLYLIVSYNSAIWNDNSKMGSVWSAILKVIMIEKSVTVTVDKLC